MPRPRIVIRCEEELVRRFRRAAADFDNYAEMIDKLLELYERRPELFGTKTKRGGRFV